MADEEGLRKEAVRRRLAGESEASVADDLGRSGRWVRKWLKRFRQGGDGWFESASRAPNRSPQATDERIERQVVEARRALEDDPRAQRGAPAVAWQLHVMGVDDEQVPPARTIERIIARHGLSKPRRVRGEAYEPKGLPYPLPAADAAPGVLHEVDPVGPRWLEGAQQVHVLNVMDIGSHRVAIEPLARQRPIWLAQRLIATWRRLGVPGVVQFDNNSNLRGAINDARKFGPVVYTALHLGVVVRYVPLEEPWRQGAIEHFQDVFDKSFFRAERFNDLDHLRERARAFEAFHNARHRYTPLGGSTPDQTWHGCDRAVDYPPDSFTVPGGLPDRGRIEAVRFIRSDLTLDLFTEKITMPETVERSYVVATITLADQQLTVTDIDGQIIHQTDHPIR